MAAEPVKEYPLVEPVEITLKNAGGEERIEKVSTVTLYKFKAKDLRCLDGLADNAHGSMILALIARMTRQPMAVVDEMGGEDIMALGEDVGGFLPSGLKAGKTG